MSGGSWNYFYRRLEEVAESLERSSDPARVALGKQMKREAEAMRAIEWADSGDHARGSEVEPIARALGEHAPALILQEVIERLRTEVNRAEEYYKRLMAPPTIRQ